jgi:hypothetical protein
MNSTLKGILSLIILLSSLFLSALLKILNPSISIPNSRDQITIVGITLAIIAFTLSFSARKSGSRVLGTAGLTLSIILVFLYIVASGY